MGADLSIKVHVFGYRYLYVGLCTHVMLGVKSVNLLVVHCCEAMCKFIVHVSYPHALHVLEGEEQGNASLCACVPPKLSDLIEQHCLARLEVLHIMLLRMCGADQVVTCGIDGCHDSWWRFEFFL